MIFAVPAPELLGGRLFVHWVETGFYDAWPEELDPDVAHTLEEVHMTFLWELRLRMKRLVQLRMNLSHDELDFPKRALPTSTRSYSREHAIFSCYRRMAEEEQSRNGWRVLNAPAVGTLAAHGPFYIIHLYSGRRRDKDFHEQIEEVLAESKGLRIRILSIDTAVDERLDVHNQKLWSFLMQIAREGRVLGLVQTPPCETWTSARHHQQYDDEGVPIRGPRPLRSAASLWGLEHLTFPELAQIFVGSSLLLKVKGLLLACVVNIHGGVTVLEHPAAPYNEEYASVWRLGIMKLFLRRPGAIFHQTTIAQWRFGAPGTKPTTLLYSNTDLPAALESCVVPGLTRPEAQLIGKDQSGRYKTAAAKEYPAALNLGFAISMRRVLSTRIPANCGDPGDEPFGHELAMMSACAEHGTIMPDYQPR